MREIDFVSVFLGRKYPPQCEGFYWFNQNVKYTPT